MKNLKNEKGISLLTLCIIIVILIVLLIIFFGSGSNNNGGTTSSSSVSKEDRSTYIAKCSTISYNSLARTPNQYKGNYYTFTGEVIQAMNESNSNETLLRVNVTPKKYEYSNETYYEDTILVYYTYSSSYESRILDNDIITLYGQSVGTYTYEAIWGNSVTVPAFLARYIDIKSK